MGRVPDARRGRHRQWDMSLQEVVHEAVVAGFRQRIDPQPARAQVELRRTPLHVLMRDLSSEISCCQTTCAAKTHPSKCATSFR